MPTVLSSPSTAPALAAAAPVFRPKEGQCVRCAERAGCRRQDFQAMPVRLVHADGTRIVDCQDFQSRRGRMN